MLMISWVKTAEDLDSYCPLPILIRGQESHFMFSLGWGKYCEFWGPIPTGPTGEQGWEGEAVVGRVVGPRRDA